MNILYTIQHISGNLRLLAAVLLVASNGVVAAEPKAPVPPAAKAAFERGNVKAEKGDVLGAIAELDAALKAAPKFAAALRNRGALKLHAGDGVGAMADLDQAIAAFEKKGEARLAAAAKRQLDKL